MSRRERYSKEFKLEAIRLLEDKAKPTSQVATELGVKRTLLYRWRSDLNRKKDAAFNQNPGRPKNSELSELSRLRQENKKLKEERDILKKAAAYFARDLE